MILLISAVGPVLLHHGLPDQRLADDVRVQPRRRDPRARALVEGQRATKVPANAVMLVAVIAALITLPALIEVNIGTEEAPLIVPTAFYAVVSVAVIGLYLAFRSRSGCAGGWATPSSRAAGTTARSTSG